MSLSPYLTNGASLSRGLRRMAHKPGFLQHNAGLPAEEFSKIDWRAVRWEMRQRFLARAATAVFDRRSGVLMGVSVCAVASIGVIEAAMLCVDPWAHAGFCCDVRRTAVPHPLANASPMFACSAHNFSLTPSLVSGTTWPALLCSTRCRIF